MASSIRAPPVREVAHLLDDRHPLAAHPDRGQHRVGPLPGGRPLGHPDQRLLAAAHVPVPARRGRACPAGGRAPPAGSPAQAPWSARHRQKSSACVDPGAEALHRVVERPAERGLPDHVPAVAGHPHGHVGPAGKDRQQAAVLEDHDAVALLEPQRPQRVRARARACRPGAWCAPRASAGPCPASSRARSMVSGAGTWLAIQVAAIGVVGGVQVGGRGRAVALHDHPPAAVRALALQQDPGLPGAGGYPGLARPSAQRRHGTESTDLPQVSDADIGGSLPVRHSVTGSYRGAAQPDACQAPPDRSSRQNGAHDVPVTSRRQPGRGSRPGPAAAAPRGPGPAERRAAAERLGQQRFRADQLSRHYFARLTDDPGDMTDVPAAARVPAGRGPAAPAAHRRAGVQLRPGPDPQDAVARVRRGLRRVGADALPGAGHDVRLVAGRVRDGVPVLRDRPGRADPQPVRRRDRGPGGGRGQGAGGRARCPAGPAGSPTSCSWAWASRWPTTRGCSPRCGGSPTRLPDGLGISRRAVTVSTVGPGPGDRQAGRRGPAGAARGVPARARRRAARRARAGEPALEGRRGAGRGLGVRRRRPGAGCRSSTR